MARCTQQFARGRRAGGRPPPSPPRRRRRHLLRLPSTRGGSRRTMSRPVRPTRRRFDRRRTGRELLVDLGRLRFVSFDAVFVLVELVAHPRSPSTPLIVGGSQPSLSVLGCHRGAFPSDAPSAGHADDDRAQRSSARTGARRCATPTVGQLTAAEMPIWHVGRDDMTAISVLTFGVAEHLLSARRRVSRRVEKNRARTRPLGSASQRPVGRYPSMIRVGYRIRLASGKGPDREGVVTALIGSMLRVRWPSQEETIVIPGPGTVDRADLVGVAGCAISGAAWTRRRPREPRPTRARPRPQTAAKKAVPKKGGSARPAAKKAVPKQGRGEDHHGQEGGTEEGRGEEGRADEEEEGRDCEDGVHQAEHAGPRQVPRRWRPRVVAGRRRGRGAGLADQRCSAPGAAHRAGVATRDRGPRPHHRVAISASRCRSARCSGCDGPSLGRDIRNRFEQPSFPDPSDD